MKSTTSFRILCMTSALLFSILPGFGQDQPSDQLVGTWTKSLNDRTVTFTLTAELSYTVEFAGDKGIDVEGSYLVSGSQITFNDEAGEYSSDEPGVYEFKVTGSSLVFTKVDDPVYGRSILLEGKWSGSQQE